MKEKTILSWIEFVLVFVLAGTCVVIAIIDIADLSSGYPWIPKRIPALTLLCLGFVAAFLIIERRIKLDRIEQQINERTDLVLKNLGIELEEFQTGGECSDAVANRIKKAKHIDDITWGEDEGEHRWSSADRAAYRRGHLAESEVICDPNVTWRKICIFFPKSVQRFEREKMVLNNKKAVGYSLAYYESPPLNVPPRIGAFMIVDGDSNDGNDGEVFLATLDDTMWLRVKSPAIVRYFANYYKSLWEKATKIKTGTTINFDLLKDLEQSMK